MNFIYVSPTFPHIYSRFCKELKNRGVNVLGIGEDYNISEELSSSLTEYYRVNSLSNYDDMYRAVAYFASKYGKIDYIESNNEYWLEQDARLRTDFNVNTGKKIDEINFFKSKEAMKTCYKNGGVKTARYIIPTTFEKGKEFVEEVGYPVIVKPDNGVGAYATYKIHNEEELKKFYFENFPNIKYIMEEFINGDLISFDGICSSTGDPLFMSNEVFPTPIMEIVNNDLDVFYYSNKDVPSDLEDVGRRTLKAFGAKSRCFHLEFLRVKEAKKGLGEVGDLIGLEVNMRCPGGYTPDMLNFAHSVSSYAIWADMIVYDNNYQDMNKKNYYCAYYARRFWRYYSHSYQDIMNKYGNRIVDKGDMPYILSGAMGNQYFVGIFETYEEMMEFKEFCSK